MKSTMLGRQPVVDACALGLFDQLEPLLMEVDERHAAALLEVIEIPNFMTCSSIPINAPARGQNYPG